MKFGFYLKKNLVPEWSKYYIHYYLLKKILSPFKKINNLIVKSVYDSQNHLTITNLTEEDVVKLKEFQANFKTSLYQQLEKVNAFYKIKMIEFI